MLCEFNLNKKAKEKQQQQKNGLSGEVQLFLILKAERTFFKEMNPSNIFIWIHGWISYHALEGPSTKVDVLSMTGNIEKGILLGIRVSFLLVM